MKTTIILGALLIMLSTGVAYAEDGRKASTTPRNVRAEMKGDNGLHLGVVMRVRGEAIRFWTLLKAHIHRLQNLITRLTERADRLDANGIDTTEGRTHLAVATTELNAAQVDLDALKLAVEAHASSTASTTPQGLKEQWKGVRDLMKSAREHIQEAYDEIKEALKAFRDAVKDANDTN